MKPSKAPLDLQSTQRADGEINPVRARFVAGCEGAPQGHRTVEQLDAGNGSANAAAEGIDQQQAAATFKYTGLALSLIAQG